MNETITWYASLIKPSWAPPSWLFGPAWTFLYILIIISFGSVFTMAARKKLPFKITLPFILNLIFNFAFTPIQFGLQNNLLAAVDVLIVLGTLIWAIIAVYPRKKWIAFMQIPYLLWVTFATVLQISITYLNYLPDTQPPPSPVDKQPIACGIENCHGLDIKCGPNPAQMCTEMYQLGDKCRQYASCNITDGDCRLADNPKFTACKACVEACEKDSPSDPMKAFECESKCG